MSLRKTLISTSLVNLALFFHRYSASAFCRSKTRGSWVSLIAVAAALASTLLFADVQNKPYYLVWDIDGTLVTNPLHSADGSIAPSPRLISAGGKTYKVRKWVPEVFTAFAHDPDVLNVVFSGGEKERNIELLKKIPLTDGSGKTLFDVVKKVLSYDDLTIINTDTTLRLSERARKDLTKVTPDLDRVILIDDSLTFALQPRKTLPVGEVFSDFDQFKDAVSALNAGHGGGAHIPADYQTWLDDQNKFARIYATLRTALDSAKKNPEAPLSDEVANAAKKDSNELIRAGTRALETQSFLPPCSKTYEALVH